MKILLKFCLSMCLFLSYNAMAGQIDLLLQQLSSRLPESQKIQYKNPSGTLMQGKLEQLIYDGRDLGEFSWTLDAKAFLSGKIAMYFRLGKGSPYKLDAQGYLETGIDKVVYAKDVSLVMPAASVIDLARRPRLYDLKGNLILEITSGSIQHNQGYCETLDGVVRWPQARMSSFSGSLNMGDINAQLGCTDNSVTIQTNQSSNQVSSLLKILINPNNRYKVTGWVKPKPRLSARMRKKVLSIGNMNPQGKISINKTGNL